MEWKEMEGIDKMERFAMEREERSGIERMERVNDLEWKEWTEL